MGARVKSRPAAQKTAKSGKPLKGKSEKTAESGKSLKSKSEKTAKSGKSLKVMKKERNSRHFDKKSVYPGFWDSVGGPDVISFCACTRHALSSSCLCGDNVCQTRTDEICLVRSSMETRA